MDNVKIYCTKGSCAQEYAEYYGVDYEITE